MKKYNTLMELYLKGGQILPFFVQYANGGMFKIINYGIYKTTNEKKFVYKELITNQIGTLYGTDNSFQVLTKISARFYGRKT
jgi:hypothetical protein